MNEWGDVPEGFGGYRQCYMCYEDKRLTLTKHPVCLRCHNTVGGKLGVGEPHWSKEGETVN